MMTPQTENTKTSAESSVVELEKATASPVAAENDEDSKSSNVELRNDSAFSHKSWKSILATCVPIAIICLLIWLDEAILATAIPRISDDFDAFDQIAWYGPSYLFGLCACQLPFGRIYKDFPSKASYLGSLLIFEVASIIQAAAPSSEAFIVGRVFAGIGGSGVLSGSLTIFSEEVPKAKLPYVMGSFGWIHGIGVVAGPIIGGAITSSSLTWRWCFYLNPIISAIALMPVLYIWKGTFFVTSEDKKSSMKSVLMTFDYVGFLCSSAAIVALLLGLQFGGSSYSWSDGRTIACIVIAGVLTLIFITVEWRKGHDALVPGSVLGTRVVSLSCLYTTTMDGALFILTYQLPLWFQSIASLSPIDSGYRIIPLLGCTILASMVGTTATGKLHYYQPFMLLGAIMLTVGCGVLTTLSPSSSNAVWIVCEILAGGGSGLGSPLTFLAVQDVLPRCDVPVGYALLLTAGYLGSSIALAIAQAVFASRLRTQISAELPSVDYSRITDSGATNMRALLPHEMLTRGLQIWNAALTRSWFIAVGLAAVSVLFVFGLKWKKMDMRDRK